VPAPAADGESEDEDDEYEVPRKATKRKGRYEGEEGGNSVVDSLLLAI